MGIARSAASFYKAVAERQTGRAPEPATGLGPAINGKPLPGFLVHLQIRQGLGSMPSFDDELIDEGQLDDLLAYIATR